MSAGQSWGVSAVGKLLKREIWSVTICHWTQPHKCEMSKLWKADYIMRTLIMWRLFCTGLCSNSRRSTHRFSRGQSWTMSENKIEKENVFLQHNQISFFFSFLPCWFWWCHCIVSDTVYWCAVYGRGHRYSNRFEVMIIPLVSKRRPFKSSCGLKVWIGWTSVIFPMTLMSD